MHLKYKNLILIFVGISFIAIGIFKGENVEVLTKATHICLECIGIG